MKTQDQTQAFNVAIYGGNGFVGTHIAKELSQHQANITCVSRTGHKPLYLSDKPWAKTVRWCKGDASQPNSDFLSSLDAIVICVGSPPLPTFSQAAYDHAVFMNGDTNVNAIHAAAEAGVKRLILLGAQIPFPMRGDKFAYAKGKRLAFEAAKEFSEITIEHRATVLKPGAIYGVRHLANGKSLPLGLVMRPLSYLMPWQFISVDRIAQRSVNLLMDERPSNTGFRVLKNRQI